MGKSEPLVKEAGATGIDDIKGTGFVKDTHSLVNIKGYVDELETRLTAVRAGYLDNINNANLATIPDISTFTAARIAHLDADISSRAAPSDILSDVTPFAGADIAAIKGYVDEVESLLKNATYGLSALKTEIDANETKIDTIDDIVDELKADAVYSMTFWGDLQPNAAIPTAVADVALPHVVVSEIPTGATIFRVIAMLKFRTVEDTSGSANALDGDQYIQVDDSSGTGYRNAIKLIDNLWTVDGNATEGGDVIVGNIDISDRVNSTDIYSFKIANARATGANLVLHDIQMGLKVFFRV